MEGTGVVSWYGTAKKIHLGWLQTRSTFNRDLITYYLEFYVGPISVCYLTKSSLFVLWFYLCFFLHFLLVVVYLFSSTALCKSTFTYLLT